MKTAISLPDPLFRSAERLAKRLKVSRSALYATAIADSRCHHQRKSVTEQLNEVYGEGGEDSTLDPVVAGFSGTRCPRMNGDSARGDRWASLPDPAGSMPGISATGCRRPIQ